MSFDRNRVGIWKLAGDGVIFMAEVGSPQEVYAISLAFTRAVIIYRKILYNDIDYFSDPKAENVRHYRDKFTSLYSGCILDVKATIWWAGFPISNRELLLSRDLHDLDRQLSSTDPRYRNLLILKTALERGIYGSESVLTDYLGPSIDIGFRLCELAKPNRAPVYVEVAYILLKCDHDWVSAVCGWSSGRRDLNLNFWERRPLSGVFGLEPYPIFFINSASDEGLSVIEDTLSGSQSKLDRKKR